MSNERTKILILGAILGTVVGIIAAWIATDAETEKAQLIAEGDQAKIRPSAKQWVTFGVSAISLLRLFSEMMVPKAAK